MSAGSPTASIVLADRSPNTTSSPGAPLLPDLDIKTPAASTGPEPRFKLMDWSEAGETGFTGSPLAQFSLAFRLQGAFPAMEDLSSEVESSAAGPMEAPGQDAAPTIQLTPRTWAQISEINRNINRAITSRTDLEIYGRSEVWATPLADAQRFGDCEDFVLEKRRALIAAGFPPKALSIAVVLTHRKERHAVLLVNSEAGEYVLDNLNAWVMPWDKTEYIWRERQVAGSANHWVGVQPAPSTKGDPDYYKQVLLASLH